SALSGDAKDGRAAGQASAWGYWPVASFCSPLLSGLPSPLSSMTTRLHPGHELFFAILELAILAMLNFVGIVLSVAGGRVGGALAILLAKRLQQSPEQ